MGVLVTDTLLAMSLPSVIYLWLHPLAFKGMSSVLWMPEGNPYHMGDIWGTLFMVQRSIFGESGCDTLLFSWPQGQNICGHFPNPLVTDFIAVFVRFWGLPLGYNLAALTFVATTGVACWGTVRLFGGRRMGALVAAAMVGLLPMLHLEIFAGRPVTAWWAPVIAASALGVSSLDSWRRFALLIPGLALMVVAMYVYPYGLAMFAPWVVMATLVAIARGPDRLGVIARAIVALAVSGGLVWWVATKTYGSVVAELTFGDPLQDRESHWGLLSPPGRPWLNPSIILGEIVLVAMVMRRAPMHRVLPIVLTGVLLVLLGLGPNPMGDPGHEAPNPIAPFTWMMRHFHLMRGCARPERYVLAAALLVPMTVGLSLGSPARWVRGVGYLALMAGMVWLKIYTTNLGPPALLAWPPVVYADVLDGGVVLELPLEFTHDQQSHMMGQALHIAPRINDNYPIANRWITSIAPSWSVLFASRDLQSGRPIPPSVFDKIAAGDREHAEGLEWVMIHRTQLPKDKPDMFEPLLRALSAHEVLRSKDLLIYRVESPD